MLCSSHPPTSDNTHHPPPPADLSLHGAVLGQRPRSKADRLDAIATRVPPFVALVAGQVQVARGGPSQGEGGLILSLQLLPGHLQPLYLVLRAPGYRRGDKSHVLSPDPVFQSWGWGCGAKGERRREAWSGSCPAPSGLCLHLASEWGQREDQTECVPCFPLLSPKDAPNLSAPSTGIVASPRVSYLPRPDPPCSGHCGCGRYPACVPQPGFHIFGHHQKETLS